MGVALGSSELAWLGRVTSGVGGKQERVCGGRQSNLTGCGMAQFLLLEPGSRDTVGIASSGNKIC